MEGFLSREKLENRRSNRDSSLSKKIEIWSFGYKYGLMEADAVVDVRFLPNPYYVEALCYLTGRDAECSAFVLQNAYAKNFVEKLAALILAMRTSADILKRPIIRIAIGCTGGQHRSVAVAEEVFRQLGVLAVSESAIHIELHHRDAEKWILSMSQKVF